MDSEETTPGPTPAAPGARHPLMTNLLVGAFVGFAVSDAFSGGVWSAAGALIPAFLWEGEWQRIALPAVLHGDPLHLVASLTLLLLVGPRVERILGRARVLALFLIACVVAAAASAAVLPRAATFTSSAGVLALVAFLIGNAVQRSGTPARLLEGWGAVAVGVASAMLLVLGFFSENLNNVVHVAGIVSGLVLSGVLGSGPIRRAIAIPAAAVIVAATGGLLLLSRETSKDSLAYTLLRSSEDYLAGHYERAIAVVAPALAAGPRGSADRLLLPAAQNELAWLLVVTGKDLERGVRLSEESVRARPVAEFLDTLGYANAMLGRCREAADAMGRAVSMDAAYDRRRAEVNRACETGRKPNPHIPVDPPAEGAEAVPGGARPTPRPSAPELPPAPGILTECDSPAGKERQLAALRRARREGRLLAGEPMTA